MLRFQQSGLLDMLPFMKEPVRMVEPQEVVAPVSVEQEVQDIGGGGGHRRRT